VCGSFLGVVKIQNGSRCHGNQGAKNIKFTQFNIFCTLVTMAMATILNLFNPPKAASHYSGYSYKVS
jgi:hypothetical protein